MDNSYRVEATNIRIYPQINLWVIHSKLLQSLFLVVIFTHSNRYRAFLIQSFLVFWSFKISQNEKPDSIIHHPLQH
jgi:hypothetical protein